MNNNNNNGNNISDKKATTTMKRILCLHGLYQSGSIMSNKIGGARRRLSRVYELHFLDGPMLLPPKGGNNNHEEQQYGWFLRNQETNKANTDQVCDAFEYIISETQGQSYDGIIGFSQGGTIATALAISGILSPTCKAVVTAGAPMSEEVFTIAKTYIKSNEGKSANDDNDSDDGYSMPKLHMAGETDSMIPLESTRSLCDSGGNGELLIHEKGHLFPTRAKYVNHMMEFLETNIQ